MHREGGLGAERVEAGLMMTGPWTAWEQGRLVANRYRLLRPLGSGGTAEVWAARDESLGRDVAIKALSGLDGQVGHECERLEREARLLAALDHPRITTVFDFAKTVEEDGASHPFLVTELLDGESLSTRLHRGPLTPHEAVTVCAQIADALATAHTSAVVHRDVKPSNVMLTSRGAVLLDFGISRREADTDLTGQALIGTPACMAPEQWHGHAARSASDVYALGCLLFWCLSGHAPYQERELPALGVAHLLSAPPPLPIYGRHHGEINATYTACLRKDPAERPSAREVAAVLEHAASSRSLTFRSSASSATPKPSRTSRAGKATAPIAATVAASATATVAAAAAAPSTAGPDTTQMSAPIGFDSAAHPDHNHPHYAAYVALASAALIALIVLPLTQLSGSPAGPAATGAATSSRTSGAASGAGSGERAAKSSAPSISIPARSAPAVAPTTAPTNAPSTAPTSAAPASSTHPSTSAAPSTSAPTSASASTSTKPPTRSTSATATGSTTGTNTTTATTTDPPTNSPSDPSTVQTTRSGRHGHGKHGG